MVDELRLNATYGMILQDLDINGYYLYDNKFTADGDWWGWNDTQTGIQTFVSRQGSQSRPDVSSSAKSLT